MGLSGARSSTEIQGKSCANVPPLLLRGWNLTEWGRGHGDSLACLDKKDPKVQSTGNGMGQGPSMFEFYNGELALLGLSLRRRYRDSAWS